MIQTILKKNKVYKVTLGYQYVDTTYTDIVSKRLIAKDVNDALYQLKDWISYKEQEGLVDDEGSHQIFVQSVELENIIDDVFVPKQ